MPIKCCKDCIPIIRHPGCHDKCSKYLKEKAELEKEKAKARKASKDQNYIIYPSDFEMLACIHKPRHKK